MDNRINQTFDRLKAGHKKAFIAYICAGDPSLAATESIVLALEAAGADIVELGVPFSDPLADGIVNQLAAQRALEAGTTVQGVFDCVAAIRKKSEIPVVLYTYLNPVYSLGFGEFFRRAAKAGVDGVLLLDMPPDEDALNEEFGSLSGLCRIRLIAPTTPADRIKQIADGADGFIYYVSREGVTGEQASVAQTLAARVDEIRQATSLPIAVGFGISNPQQAAEVARSADAVVVGSAIVKRIAQHALAPDLAGRIREFVIPLAVAVKAV
jgi:tryptophan synthase alpha chain